MVGFRHPIHLYTSSVMVGANQLVHSFLGGKGLDIQQGTSVWVGSPKSTIIGRSWCTIKQVLGRSPIFVLFPNSSGLNLKIPVRSRLRYLNHPFTTLYNTNHLIYRGGGESTIFISHHIDWSTITRWHPKRLSYDTDMISHEDRPLPQKKYYLIYTCTFW